MKILNDILEAINEIKEEGYDNLNFNVNVE